MSALRQPRCADHHFFGLRNSLRIEDFDLDFVHAIETTEQATFGMLANHLVSIADMVGARKAYPQEAWDEKITDSIN